MTTHGVRANQNRCSNKQVTEHAQSHTLKRAILSPTPHVTNDWVSGLSKTYGCQQPGREEDENGDGKCDARRTKRDGRKAVSGVAATAHSLSRHATANRRALVSHVMSTIRQQHNRTSS